MTFKTKDDRIFKLLEKAAKTSVYATHRHATAIVYRRNVIAVGVNQRKTHTLQKRFSGREAKTWLHSEIAAIVKVINRFGPEILKDCELYNLRLTKAGNIGISKPCAACQKAIDGFGIGKVYWS